MFRHRVVFLACASVVLLGCDSNLSNDALAKLKSLQQDAGAAGSGGDRDAGAAPGSSADKQTPSGTLFGNSDQQPTSLTDADVQQQEPEPAECGAVSAAASIKPVHLAFAFDVSGSMGEGDKPWHDRTLKWDPVVTATRAFFEDSSMTGISASMTFFPSDDAVEPKCDDASYVAPDVPMTALPSTAFGAALDVIGSSPWRGGTPSLQVMNGVASYIQAAAQSEPGVYAIVVVTDGHPEGCDDPDIQVVADAAAAVSNVAPTYVIGVANPPLDGAPDVLGNLDLIAQEGGTQHAFIVDTGDPTQTEADFAAVIDQIRGTAVPCNADIPAPPDGRVFDKRNVAVTYTSGAETHSMDYDPNCETDNGWRYDDPSAPTEVVLCASTCGRVQADPDAQLNVEFGCEPVIQIPD